MDPQASEAFDKENYDGVTSDSEEKNHKQLKEMNSGWCVACSKLIKILDLDLDLDVNESVQSTGDFII